MRIPTEWRLSEQRIRLKGSKCPHCGEIQFPPRNICTACGENVNQDAYSADQPLAIPIIQSIISADK